MAKKELTYTEAMDELSSILDDLKQERVDVDEVSSKVKRAAELIKLCRKKIEDTEFEVKNIVTSMEKDILSQERKEEQ